MPEQRIVPTPAQSNLPTWKIMVEGTEINSAYQVLTIRVEKNFGKLAEAEITFLDGSASSEDFPVSNSDEFIPGKTVEIHAGYHGNNAVIFKGKIIKHAIKIMHDDASVMHLTLKHEAFKCAVTRSNKVFRDMKDSEAIEELINSSSIDCEVESTEITHESLVQYNISDWDFINIRAEANGLLVFTDNDKIVIKKPDLSANSELSLYYGSSIIEFEAEIDGRTSFNNYKISAWDSKNQEVKEVEEASSSVSIQSGNLTISDLANSMNQSDFTVTNNGTLSEDELQILAKAKILKNNLAKIRGRVKCTGIAEIIPGNIITLHGVGNRFNGKVLVSGVAHSVNQGLWETDIQFGLDEKFYISKFTDVNENPAMGLWPSVNGLQTAKVIQLKEDPDGENRILVHMPMLSGNSNTVWARVSTLDAGNQRGSFFLPEIDDEVIVGFIDNDPRKAIILGMVHSSKLPAPIEATDENHIKGIYTRSKMKIEFDDENKITTISTDGGNKIILSDKDKGITLEDQNGNKIEMNADGINIESTKEIKIKAGTDLKAEGVNIELKASAQFKSEGSGGAELKSSGSTTIRGSIVNIN